MGGFLGIGQSKSEKQDRALMLQGQQGLNSAFNYGLATAKAGQDTGQGIAGSLMQSFQSLLNPTRSGTAANAAPATNAALNQRDATTRQAASMGTGRSGGTAAIQRGAGAQTQATIDDIINQNLIGGQQEARQGEGQLASAEFQNAQALLGIGSSAQSSALSSEGQELQTDIQKQNELGMAMGQIIGIGAKLAFPQLRPGGGGGNNSPVPV